MISSVIVAIFIALALYALHKPFAGACGWSGFGDDAGSCDGGDGGGD